MCPNKTAVAIALCQGTLTSQCVQKNLNTTVLQVTCTLQQSSRVFFIRVFKGTVYTVSIFI